MKNNSTIKEVIKILEKAAPDIVYTLFPNEKKRVIKKIAQKISTLFNEMLPKEKKITLKDVIDWWFEKYPEDIFIKKPKEIIEIRNLMKKLKHSMPPRNKR